MIKCRCGSKRTDDIYICVCGITQDNEIVLSREEALSIVNELGKTFIDRDNPLCSEVLNKLMRFVNDV